MKLTKKKKKKTGIKIKKKKKKKNSGKGSFFSSFFPHPPFHLQHSSEPAAELE